MLHPTGTRSPHPYVEVHTRLKPVQGTPTTATTDIKTWDEKLLPSGATALVRFVDVESCLATLRCISSRTSSSSSPSWAGATSVGVARYSRHHKLRFPSAAHLQGAVDKFMAGFNAEEARQAAAARGRSQQVGEDGFVTVTRGSRINADGEAKRLLVEKERKKTASAAGVGGFYRFQVREERKRRHLELIRKFEDDRKIVEERKKGRRFAPES